jgi:hypothetical protein
MYIRMPCVATSIHMHMLILYGPYMDSRIMHIDFFWVEVLSKK